MVEFTALLELQRFDLAIDEVELKIKQHHAKVEKLAADIKKEEDLVHSKEALLKKITLRRRKAETDILEENEKVKTLNLKMQRAGLSPDSYRALEKELETAKGKISNLETSVLADMEKIEVLQKDTEKGAKVVVGRKAQLEEMKKRVHDQTIDLRKEKELALTQRRQATMGIPVDILSIYEELRQKSKGRVIYDADKSSCPACGMSITVNFIKQINGTNCAENCPNCGLLLRWVGILDGIHV